MSQAEVVAALERVIDAARAHLGALSDAGGDAEAEAVWAAYVVLNNATCQYDQLLLDDYGALSPWDTDLIDSEAAATVAVAATGARAGAPRDPYPQVVSVRQRRDYFVPSVTRLLRLAESARTATEIEARTVGSVGEAVLVLVDAGDGCIGSLDLEELEPLQGVMTVTEVVQPLDLGRLANDDGAAPFAVEGTDRLVGRLDERPFPSDVESAGPATGEA